MTTPEPSSDDYSRALKEAFTYASLVDPRWPAPSHAILNAWTLTLREAGVHPGDIAEAFVAAYAARTNRDGSVLPGDIAQAAADLPARPIRVWRRALMSGQTLEVETLTGQTYPGPPAAIFDIEDRVARRIALDQHRRDWLNTQKTVLRALETSQTA